MSNSFKSQKSFLTKYCYVNSGSRSTELVRTEISNCQDDSTINTIYRFMQSYIMPFYHTDRRVFNSVRNYFMCRVYSILLSKSPMHSLYGAYKSWLTVSCAYSSTEAVKVIDSFKDKFNDEYTQVFNLGLL